MAEISRYLLEGGGKRLRPALLLLSAGYAGYRGGSAIRLGAVVELIHSATLIHDDVIDGANTRRGRPSSNSRWGNHRSVLAGDWLYMQSFQMALAERNFKILDVLIELTQNMVEGRASTISQARADGFDRTGRRGTGGAQNGLLVLQVAPGWARSLGIWTTPASRPWPITAIYAGLAFQLVDDVLDFTASPETLGKPVLSDLKEGKVTLPLIYALESDGAAGKRMVHTVLEEKGFESVRPEQITALVHESGALDRTRAAAHDFATRAKACLNGNGTSDFGRALRTVPDFILDRDN